MGILILVETQIFVLGSHFGTNKLKMLIPSVLVTLFLRSYLLVYLPKHAKTFVVALSIASNI